MDKFVAGIAVVIGVLGLVFGLALLFAFSYDVGRKLSLLGVVSRLCIRSR